ncbi:MAG: phosphoribosylaminoimidazolesuccinocarboxamide synthase [Pseudomonadota bacterium]
MNSLSRVETPQLRTLHRGKVRDSFRVDERTRLIVVTDRLSAFDRVLDSPIPGKGEVLNQLSAWWFEQTRDLVGNHLVRTVGPSASLVREATPIKIEMVVRGYITGSMWRGYLQGERSFSGTQVPDGLTENQQLPVPIVTPTTKEKNDRPVTPAQIVAEGWASAAHYAAMQDIALALFERGRELLAQRGILLVDTKYEFGLVAGELVLIDEIHTPDSSRFWDAEAHARDPGGVDSLDKEFVRRWLLDHPQVLQGERVVLPNDVIAGTVQRYRDLYRRITGAALVDSDEPPAPRLLRALVREGLLQDGYVAVIMGSPVDRPHCDKIREVVERYAIFCDLRVMSAHKNGERVLEAADEYNGCIEPGAVIAVAGRSNGLGGALAANLNLPVINSPPFKDQLDMLTNINSSLMMPSRTPAASVVGAETAAIAALRSLNLPRLKRMFDDEITRTKAELLAADAEVRGRAP